MALGKGVELRGQRFGQVSGWRKAKLAGVVWRLVEVGRRSAGFDAVLSKSEFCRSPTAASSTRIYTANLHHILKFTRLCGGSLI